MKKRFNPNLAKLHRSYTITEVAALYGIHKNTVRSWIKEGLPKNDNKRPILILGKDLRLFLQVRRDKGKYQCGLHEIYCLRCRVARRPAGDMTECVIANPLTIRLIALCPVCHSVINKFAKLSLLAELRQHLDVVISSA